MAVILKPKQSTTPGAVPTTAALADGEMAVNTADKKWYVRVGAAIVDMTASGGGGMTWTTITSANVATAVTNTGYVMETGGTTRTITLPASVSAGFNIGVNASGGSVRVVSNGNVIDGVGSGNDLLVANGESLLLVAKATGSLEVVFARSSGAGGSAPGGGSGKVQYNNAGTFNGAANAEIENGNLRVLVPTTPPLSTAANGNALFSVLVGGREMPAAFSSSGQFHTFQPHVGRNSVSLWQAAGNSTTISVIGDVALTATGTATAANWATTSIQTKTKRVEYLVTTAATTAVAGFRLAAAKWTIGSTAADGTGGFHFVCRWGPATGVATATTRCFVGMANTTAAPTDVNPSTITNIVGMGWDSGDTNIQILYRGTGTVAKIDLGSDFPRPSADRTDVYELTLYSPPGTTQTVGYRVEKLGTGKVASGVITTNLPTTSTALAPRGWMSVGGTSSVIGIALMTLYIESDL